jgi:hypothetical protein
LTHVFTLLGLSREQARQETERRLSAPSTQ